MGNWDGSVSSSLFNGQSLNLKDRVGYGLDGVATPYDTYSESDAKLECIANNPGYEFDIVAVQTCTDKKLKEKEDAEKENATPKVAMPPKNTGNSKSKTKEPFNWKLALGIGGGLALLVTALFVFNPKKTV